MGHSRPTLHADSTLHALPLALYRAEQTRELDRLTITQGFATGFELMQSAGREAYRLLKKQWPDCQHLVIFCGGGNNGGDGYVVARLAKQQNMAIDVIALVPPHKLKGEAADAYVWACEVDVNIQEWSAGRDFSGLLVSAQNAIVVDALLGTGIQGDVRDPFKSAINLINKSCLPVLAIDIPSGLCSDTGRVLGGTIKANQTISFIGLKQGLLTGQAPDYVGQLTFFDLAVPESVYAQVPSQVQRADWRTLMKTIPSRTRSAHKGAYGKVLVVGGDLGMAGAAIMAAESACRVGAGLVYLATRPEHVMASVARCPEVMAQGVSSVEQLRSMLEKVDVVVIGPGLGQSDWSKMLFDTFVDFDRASAFHTKAFKKCVLDADALNLLAQSPEVDVMSHWVMTPHPGEAARLLKCPIKEVEADRFQAIFELNKQLGGQFILKGAGTLIAPEIATDKESAHLWLANTGNPGMAAGGMGDVLSGIIGGLAGQPIENDLLLPIAVALHGEAANIATEKVGEMSLCATDLIRSLPELLKQC